MEIVQLAMGVSAASAAEATRERDTVAMRGAAMIIVSLVAVGLAFLVGMMVGRQQAAKDVGKVVAAAHRARFDFVLQATTGRVPLDAAMSDVVDAEEDERWRTCMEVGLPIADYIATEWMNDVSASSGMEAAQLVQEYVKTNAGGIAYVRNQRHPTKPKRRKPRPAKRSPAADSE